MTLRGVGDPEDPPPDEGTFVTVLLPIYNEPARLVHRLLKACISLDFPQYELDLGLGGPFSSSSGMAMESLMSRNSIDIPLWGLVEWFLSGASCGRFFSFVGWNGLGRVFVTPVVSYEHGGGLVNTDDGRIDSWAWTVETGSFWACSVEKWFRVGEIPRC